MADDQAWRAAEGDPVAVVWPRGLTTTTAALAATIKTRKSAPIAASGASEDRPPRGCDGAGAE
jgi:hypothetical protein